VNRRRLRALGGIAGPAAFITTWATLGATRAGYSPVDDPISRLAAVGASTRPAMSAGFVAFAAGVGAYAPALRVAFGPGPARAAAVTAAASLGVAALPLDASFGDHPHAVAAGLAYASLAATPLLAARVQRARGHHRAAWLSTATAVAVGGALVASTLVPRGVGLAQRTGLTVGDLWIMGSAALLLRRPPRCHTGQAS
jgi:hypothetical protein